MKHLLGAAVAALVASLTVAAPAAAETSDEPTRVLIVGDSVTQGYKGDYTWRYFLWRALDEADVPVDFVGRRMGVFNHDKGYGEWDYAAPDAYADPNFDQDHGASWGGRLSSQENFLHDPIGPQVTAQQPDVVVGMWGVNDLARSDIGPADLVALYRAWVAEARAADPDVELVISRLPSTWLYGGEVVEFNRLVGEMAAEVSTEQSRVAVATMTETYTEGIDTTDHVHPSISGQRKLAGMVRTALADISPAFAIPPAPVPTPPTPVADPPAIPVEVAPAPVQVPSQATAPTKPRGVKAVRRGGRVVVSWRPVVGAESYVARCGRTSKTVVRAKVAVRGRAATCAVRAANAAGASPWSKARIS